MTDEEIVAATNALAGEFYKMMGYRRPSTFKFYEATHPQEVLVWQMAVTAQLHLKETDVENALANVED